MGEGSDGRRRAPGPWQVLDVLPGAGDEEIRKAYLAQVRQFPPDRAPERFEEVRDAYDTLRDPVRRSRLVLEAEDPLAPVASLLEGARPARRFVGPEPWLRLLKES